MRSRPWRLALAIAAVYVTAAKLGFTMPYTSDQVALVGPAGLALSALLLFGTEAWPGIFLGSFIANATSSEPPIVAAGIAVGNTLAAVAAAWLFRRSAGFVDVFDRLRHVLGLVVFGAIFAAISATIGVSSLRLGMVQPWANYGSLWWTWWLADLTGVLLIAPVLLTSRSWSWLRGPARAVEAALLVGGLAAVTIGVFSGALPAGATHRSLEYIAFPFLIWAAIRFGIPGAALANLGTSAIAMWGTVHAVGPYATGDLTERLVMLQLFMTMVAVTSLLLAAAVSERNAAARRLRAQHAVTQVLAGAPHADGAARRILEVICGDLDWEAGLLWQLDDDVQQLRCVDFYSRSSTGFPYFEGTSRARTFAAGKGLPGRVWAERSPLWVADVQRDDDFLRSQVAAAEGLHGAFAFPIVLDGDVVGVCEFYTRSVRRRDADLLQMFVAIGAVVGQFLAHTRVEQEIRDSDPRKTGLIEAALDCVITIDHKGRIVEFNSAAERTFGYRREDVLGRELVDLVLPKSFRTEHREGLTRYLERGTSRLIGRRLEITAMRADGTEFPAELSIAEVPSAGRPMFTGFLRDMTKQRRMVKQLAFRASHDPLTKSLNRSAFMERMRLAARRAAAGDDAVVAVLFVDIDQFKAINDTLGHFVGDRLLVATARRLRGCVRPGDAVARLGGDEFAVLLENVVDQAEAAVVANRVKESMREPFNLHGHEVAATASIGIALGLPGGEALDELLRAADEAMYRAKVAGRGLVAGL